jgi:hypothetical protein
MDAIALEKTYCARNYDPLPVVLSCCRVAGALFSGTLPAVATST